MKYSTGATAYAISPVLSTGADKHPGSPRTSAATRKPAHQPLQQKSKVSDNPLPTCNNLDFARNKHSDNFDFVHNRPSDNLVFVHKC